MFVIFAARLSVEIDNNFAPKYAVIKGQKKNFVKELEKKAEEAEYIYLATEP